MFGDVFVVNVKSYRGECVYIGRRCGEFSGSVLGNKFKIGVDGDRGEVIEKYKVWVWGEYKKGGVVKSEIDRLVGLVRGGKDIYLGCWCYPKDCHGDVLKKLIVYLLNK